jgi:hypothetical protein
MTHVLDAKLGARTSIFSHFGDKVFGQISVRNFGEVFVRSENGRMSA